MDEEQLRHYAGLDRVVLSTDFWDLIKDQKPPRKFMSGFPRLDKAIDGFESEEVIVVSGPTSMGKTTFCRSIMLELAKSGNRALFFSYENSPKKIAFDHKDEDKAIYMPLDHKAMSIGWLQDRCVEAALKYDDLSAIFIDHLHYVVDMASRGNMSLELGQTMRFIKQNIAVALNLPVFVVAHMTKIRPDEEPNMTHLRDSALIACEADTVLVIWRKFQADANGNPVDDIEQNDAILKVEKARRVGTMGRKIPMYKDGIGLVELNG